MNEPPFPQPLYQSVDALGGAVTEKVEWLLFTHFKMRRYRSWFVPSHVSVFAASVVAFRELYSLCIRSCVPIFP